MRAQWNCAFPQHGIVGICTWKLEEDEGFGISDIRLYEYAADELLIIENEADNFYNISDVFIMKNPQIKSTLDKPIDDLKADISAHDELKMIEEDMLIFKASLHAKLGKVRICVQFFEYFLIFCVRIPLFKVFLRFAIFSFIDHKCWEIETQISWHLCFYFWYLFSTRTKKRVGAIISKILDQVRA